MFSISGRSQTKTLTRRTSPTASRALVRFSHNLNHSNHSRDRPRYLPESLTLGNKIMSRNTKVAFWLLTGLAIASTAEPFAMYTMTTIHVSSIERCIVASACIAVVVFTIGVWRHHRWMLTPAVASNALFGSLSLYGLLGTFQSHNYTTLSCLILPLLFATSAFVAAIALIVWGAKYSQESEAQQDGPHRQLAAFQSDF